MNDCVGRSYAVSRESPYFKNAFELEGLPWTFDAEWLISMDDELEYINKIKELEERLAASRAAYSGTVDYKVRSMLRNTSIGVTATLVACFLAVAAGPYIYVFYTLSRAEDSVPQIFEVENNSCGLFAPKETRKKPHWF